MSLSPKARVSLALFLSLCFVFVLQGCQATPPTPEAGSLWIDTTQDLGVINKFVMGGNHGPWAEFNPFAFQKTIDLGITFLRWPGGNWGDDNDVANWMIDNYIAQARKIGAEPSITVRVPGSTPEKAAEMVRYTNIEKGYGVKYWNLGNEPSLYDNHPGKQANMPGGWTPQVYARIWREFAVAMEAVDPTILFYGPDIHQFIGGETASPSEGDALDYLVEFLRVNGDMVDVVTVHRYPFPSCNTCGPPTWEELRDNTSEWSSMLPNLRQIIKENTGKDLPVGVMEFNSNYTNAAGGETTPDSFYNALWLADVLGRLIEDRPEMLAYWLIMSNSAGHGLTSSFHVYSLWKKFGNHLLAASSDTQYVTVYEAKTDEGAVTVMLINLNSEEIRKPLKLAKGDAFKLSEAYLFDAGHNAEAVELPAFENGGEFVLPAESVTLLVFK
jgi:hypothetical protein